MIKSPASGSVLILFLCLNLSAAGQVSGVDNDTLQAKLPYNSYYDILIPELKVPKAEKPVLVAVVDDGFLLAHKEFTGLIHINSEERPSNLIDDDGNGKIDDIWGWDLADNDNDVAPPEGSENIFFHGTFVASTIVTLGKLCFGEDIRGLIEILPVKVLSDYSRLPDYSAGYSGIEYAMDQGADIICCAWSGGRPSPEEMSVVEKALSKGIIIVGSAGNAYKEGADPPGSIEGVLTVAGIDSLMRKTASSNYGSGIDLAAPATNIKAAYPLAENSYFLGSGTSGAAGIAAGSCAVLKAMFPDRSSEDIKNALINTAVPLDEVNTRYAGKLGAGLVRLRDAVEYLEDQDESGRFFLSARAKGRISINKYTKKLSEWTISPSGSYNGIVFRIDKPGRYAGRSILNFYKGDSLWYSSGIKDLPVNIFVPGNEAGVSFIKKGFGRPDLHLDYIAQPLDSSSLFCSGLMTYEIESAWIDDGSGDHNYSNNSSCKWLLKAAEGKKISIAFNEFDTQPGVDFLYIFDGESTIPGNMIAKFSGSDLPLSITSRTNTVLVWFVTDGSVTGKGWSLSYEFTE
jgi:hypothetical protein